MLAGLWLNGALNWTYRVTKTICDAVVHTGSPVVSAARKVGNAMAPRVPGFLAFAAALCCVCVPASGPPLAAALFAFAAIAPRCFARLFLPLPGTSPRPPAVTAAPVVVDLTGPSASNTAVEPVLIINKY